MTATLLAVGPVLVTVPATVTSEMREAFSTSLLWSERVARKAASDPTAPDFYTDVRDEFGRVGWFVENADSTRYDHSGSPPTPASVLRGIAGDRMPAAGAAPLLAVLDRIESGRADSALGAFLTTWWAAVADSATSTVFSTTPLTLDGNGQVSATLAFLDFGTARTDWQSFFVSDVSSETRITLRSATITLNADLWRLIRTDIETKLGQAALDSIASLDL